jgi:hypothetical protein
MLTKETRLARSRNKKDELYANIKIVVNLRPGRQGRIVDPNDYNNRGLCEICPDGFFDERIAAVNRASDQARPAFVESPEKLWIFERHTSRQGLAPRISQLRTDMQVTNGQQPCQKFSKRHQQDYSLKNQVHQQPAGKEESNLSSCGSKQALIQSIHRLSLALSSPKAHKNPLKLPADLH